jgi:site-specific DNA recombinase
LVGDSAFTRHESPGQIIEKVVHPALVSDGTFADVQQMLAGRSCGQHKPHRSRHDYALRGLLVCGLCDRRMQGHWANAAPYYRCTFATEYGLANHVQHPRNVTLRQDAILGPSTNGSSGSSTPGIWPRPSTN